MILTVLVAKVYIFRLAMACQRNVEDIFQNLDLKDVFKNMNSTIPLTDKVLGTVMYLGTLATYGAVQIFRAGIWGGIATTSVAGVAIVLAAYNNDPSSYVKLIVSVTNHSIVEKSCEFLEISIRRNTVFYEV